jgi:hypothetical protein
VTLLLSIGEILSDIQTQGIQATNIIDRHRTRLQSRQVDMKPIDLHAVINDSLILVDHDMRARHIAASVQLSETPCIVNGDPVLLEQVLVNLVMNAMDAMAETPRSRRSVTNKSEVRATDVQVSVRALARVSRHRSMARCSLHSSPRNRTGSSRPSSNPPKLTSTHHRTYCASSWMCDSEACRASSCSSG